jgi:hypothetical protein
MVFVRDDCALESRDSATPEQAAVMCGVRLLCKRNYAKSADAGKPFGEMGMADHAQVEYATATGNDYPAHEQMYRNFITLVKTVVAVVVTIVILMAIFLT